MPVLDQFRLDGKRALVTGGSRGLGLEMSRALGEAGAQVIITGSKVENLHKACEELCSEDLHVTSIQADLSKPEEAERLCDVVLREHAPIDILINNVGGRRDNIPFVDQSLEDWQRLMDLNLTSVYVCSRLLAKPMLQRGWGRVINIASICGTIAGRNIHGRHYETAKAAVVGMTRSLGADWCPRGVTVNAIAPGGFMTDANRRWFRERPEFQKEFESHVPMGRLGEPDEIGPLAVYLASDASTYMTGAVLTIDGGYTLW